MDVQCTRGNVPVYPCEVAGVTDGQMVGRQTGSHSGIHVGITLREWYAGLAMQGLLAYPGEFSAESTAKSAVDFTDALLAELAK